MEDTDRRSVIVCGHVLRRERPILRVVRDEPDDPADSGWQAVCNVIDHAADETPDGALIALHELLELEPSLRPWTDVPPPVELERDSPSLPWRVV